MLRTELKRGTEEMNEQISFLLEGHNPKPTDVNRKSPIDFNRHFGSDTKTVSAGSKVTRMFRQYNSYGLEHCQQHARIGLPTHSLYNLLSPDLQARNFQHLSLHKTKRKIPPFVSIFLSSFS